MSKLATTALVMALMAKSAGAGYSSGSEIYPLPSGQFEVITEVSPANSDYWCAAGTYAMGRLSKAAGQLIYVWKGRGNSQSRPGKTAVLFGFSAPPAGAVSSLSNSVDIVGNAVPVSMAKQYCSDRLIND